MSGLSGNKNSSSNNDEEVLVEEEESFFSEVWQPWPPSALIMARTALSLTSQDWSQTGRGPGHPTLITTTNKNPFAAAMSSSSSLLLNSIVEEITERMVSLLLIRMVALVTCRLGNVAVVRQQHQQQQQQQRQPTTTAVVTSDTCAVCSNHVDSCTSSDNNINEKGGGGGGGDNSSNSSGSSSNNNNSTKYPKCHHHHRRIIMREKMYADYSTSTICRTALKTAIGEKKKQQQQQQNHDLSECNKNHNNNNKTNNIVSTNNNDDDDNDPNNDGSDTNKILTDDADADATIASTTSSPPIMTTTTTTTTLRQYSSEPPSSSFTNTNQQHSTTTTTTGLFPRCITPEIIHQLRTYVHTICSHYHSPHRVPYHNVEHAYHVFLSANKLLDLMLCENDETEDDNKLLGGVDEEEEGGGGVGGTQQPQQTTTTTSSTTTTTTTISPTSQSNHHNHNNNPRPKFRRATLDSLLFDHRPTYGIKSDPLTQLAFLFSALVHDVDHTGISNRQLVMESDDLAILYNDQSVAEQRSLAVAFSTLKKGEFDELRRVLFEGGGGGSSGGGGGGNSNNNGGGGDGGGTAAPPAATTTTTAGGNEEFFKFRKLVIDLVLVTDIASPERTQIVKSKWKEAFGEVIVAEKMKKEKSFRLGGGGGGGYLGGSGGGRGKREETIGKNVAGGELSSSSRRQEVMGSSRGEGKSNNNNGNNNNNNNNTTPGGDGAVKTVTRRFRRTSLESVGRTSSQASILTSDISLSSKSKTSDLDLKYGCDNDDNDSTDARSIDISESSSISDIQSLDDDFDASAVSRTKMNLDPNSSGDNGSLASGNENPNEQQQQPPLNKIGPNGPRDQFARPLLHRIRRSTGDIAEPIQEEPAADPPSRGRSTESRPLSNRRRTTIAVRGPNAIRGRLSQSMAVTSQELSGPRARSEERRLGVRRALDLAGSTIIAYNNNRSSLRSSGGSDDPDTDFDLDDDWDEIDEFKATVVLEQMIRAADVAALLQDWNNVMKWSTRLYKELKNGFLSDRGEDPAIGWYDNQIKFFDFYIKPLAKNLGVMGVFDEKVGHSFVDLVKSNLARWIEDGELATMMMIKQDEKERGNKKDSKRHQLEGIERVVESESGSFVGTLSLGDPGAEVKLSALSLSGTLSGPMGNLFDESDTYSFNSASTASTTNQSSTRLNVQAQHSGD